MSGDRRDRRRRRQSAGDERRSGRRRSRAERYTGGTDHNARVCPDCRTQVPYLDPIQDAPAECPECGYLWDCPACGQAFEDSDRDEEGRPPAICPACDAGVTGGFEVESGSEEPESWTDM